MAANYQKLYAYMVGQVDDAIEMMESSLTGGSCGRDELAVAATKLKAALIAAEEMYLDDTEEAGAEN